LSLHRVEAIVIFQLSLSGAVVASDATQKPQRVPPGLAVTLNQDGGTPAQPDEGSSFYAVNC
jgi:hypothetical protein